MSKQTRGSRLADTKITLPLTQTVFLPKTAVGVRYIDKIRATVFIDDLQRSGDTVWLRGFYELDMEYQGMEGRGLNKYRIMLPLKVQTPPGWLGGLQYEAADLHGAVARPMVKILSPYVLDFSGTLNLEYVGDYRWQEDKTAAAPAPSAEAVHTLSSRRRVWTSDIPMPDADAVDKRIESKIDRFFLGAAGDKTGEPRLIRSSDEPGDMQPSRTAAAEPSEPPLIRVTGETPLRPQVKVTQIVNVPAEPVPQQEQKTAAEPAETSRIPVWHFPEPDLRPVNTVENPVEKPVGIPVYNPVENTVESSAAAAEAERTANMEQIYAPKLNKNRFRTLLTTAALAKLKARGESLQAAAEAQAAAETAEAGEPAVVVKPVEPMAMTETAAAPVKEAENLTEQNDVNETVVEKTAAPEAAEVSAAVESGENPTAEVESPVENAAAETVAAAAEQSVAEPAAAEASSLETEAAAEEIAEVAVEAEETAEVMAEVAAETAEAAAPVEPAAADVELKLVNANGVRLKMSAAQPARAAQAPAPAEGAKKAGAFSMRFYVVKPGDQPMSIALKNNISLESLLAANRITEGDLKAGTVLRIPG